MSETPKSPKKDSRKEVPKKKLSIKESNSTLKVQW